MPWSKPCIDADMNRYLNKERIDLSEKYSRTVWSPPAAKGRRVLGGYGTYRGGRVRRSMSEKAGPATLSSNTSSLNFGSLSRGSW